MSTKKTFVFNTYTKTHNVNEMRMSVERMRQTHARIRIHMIRKMYFGVKRFGAIEQHITKKTVISLSYRRYFFYEFVSKLVQRFSNCEPKVYKSKSSPSIRDLFSWQQEILFGGENKNKNKCDIHPTTIRVICDLIFKCWYGIWTVQPTNVCINCWKPSDK